VASPPSGAALKRHFLRADQKRLLQPQEKKRAMAEPSVKGAIEGFLNECAHAAREDLIQLYTSERPASDLILFRMTRDIADMSNRE
jgi:hypothetical protein